MDRSQMYKPPAEPSKVVATLSEDGFIVVDVNKPGAMEAHSGTTEEEEMKITNEKLLDLYRTPGRCEYCRKPCLNREPHHVVSRGAGGGDIRLNLIALGSTSYFQCECHRKHHDGHEPTTADLIARVAEREGCDPLDVVDAVKFIINIPPRLSKEQIKERIEDAFLLKDVVKLVRRELSEAKIL